MSSTTASAQGVGREARDARGDVAHHLEHRRPFDAQPIELAAAVTQRDVVGNDVAFERLHDLDRRCRVDV